MAGWETPKLNGQHLGKTSNQMDVVVAVVVVVGGGGVGVVVGVVVC